MIYTESVESAACSSISNVIVNETVESEVQDVVKGAIAQEEEDREISKDVGDDMLEQILYDLVKNTHEEIWVYQEATKQVGESLEGAVVSELLEEILVESQNEVCQTQAENKRAINMVHKEMVNKVVFSEVTSIMKGVWVETASQQQVTNTLITNQIEVMLTDLASSTLETLETQTQHQNR